MNKQFVMPTLVVGIIAVIIIALQLLGWLWPFRLVYDQVANPIGARLVQTRNTISEQLKILTSISTINKENKALRNSELELRQQLAALKEVARENELLRSQFEFNAKLNLDLVAARVVSVDPTTTRKYITIDRGSSSGVKTGQAVVSSGVLVGVVDRVNDYSSTVFLAIDPNFRLRGLGQDGRAQGIIRGQIGQGYLFEKITQAESISVGEQVITAGSGEVPQGILIGRVDSVNKTQNSVFQSAQVQSLLDFNSLELVFIVTGLKQ